MEVKRPAIFDTLLKFIPVLVALFVPVFFLPLTTEFFEFNKLVLVAVATILMLVAWIFKMIREGSVEVTKSPLDLAITVFGITLLLATIFSLNQNTSIFGSGGRWFPSLIGFVVLVLFYYAVTANLKGKESIRIALKALIAGISVSSFVALLGYFGIRLGQTAYLQVPNFTLTGSTTSTSLLAALACILVLHTILTARQDAVKVGLVALFTLNILTVLLAGGIAAWALLIAGLISIVYLTNAEEIIKNKVHLVAAFVATMTIVFALILPFTRSLIVNENYPRELSISPRESWIVSSSILRDFPILGTGPSTFSINYTRYKPLSVNAENYWNVRFDKPYNEVFGVIGSMGIIGLIAALALTIKTVKFALDSKNFKDKEVSVGLAAGVLGILAALLFSYATVSLSIVLVLLLALLVVAARSEPSSGVETTQLKLASFAETGGMSLISSRKESEVFQYILAVPLTLLALAGSFYVYKLYAAEHFMRRAVLAVQAGDGRTAYQMQQRAIQMNPQRANYQNSFATTNLALAQSISSRQGLTDEDRTTVQTLVAQAIRSTRLSTEDLNPLSALGWETRATIYRSLIGAAQDADTWTIRSYTTAIQLDPVNPRLRIALGGVYYAAGDYLSAANLFTQATNLKSDYANAHYNLAQAFRQLQRYDQAHAQLLITQGLVAEDSEDYAKVAAELGELSQLVNVAGAATEPKPTVSELENAGDTEGGAQEEAQQEPLVNEGETVSESEIDETQETTENEPQQ